MIRDATFSDIPAIVVLLETAYARTHYAKSGLAEIDRGEAKRLLVNSIQRHGGRHGGSCWVKVSESGAGVTGFILGTLVRLYSIGTKLSATDLFWLASPDADPFDAARLMRSMIDWATTSPEVVEVNCGTTAIMNDPEEAGKMLRHMGMKQYGLMFRMELC